MKVKNGTIQESREPLKNVMGITLPVMVSKSLVELSAKLDAARAIIDQTRNRLIQDYGEETGGHLSIQATVTVEKDGQKVEEPNPNWPKFVAEFNSLMNEETELDVKGKVKVPGQMTVRCSGCRKALTTDIQIAAEDLIALTDLLEVADA